MSAALERRTRIFKLPRGEAVGRCEEPVRHPKDIVPGEGGRIHWAASDGGPALVCSRPRMFDVNGKRVCRWHASAIAFDILSKEARP